MKSEDDAALPAASPATLPIERRSLDAARLSAERGLAEDGPVIVGRAAVFGSLSEDLGGFRERFDRGAFADSLARDDIRALVDHRSELVLGRNRAGTLVLDEDDECLHVRIAPPATSYARDLIASIERGDISGMSIGFRAVTDGWNVEDGQPVRTIREAMLFDVSVVAFPAYPQTEAALRSLQAFRAGQAGKPPAALDGATACGGTPLPAPWRLNLARRRLDCSAAQVGAWRER